MIEKPFIKEKVLEEIEEELQKLFFNLQEIYGIKTGDISPEHAFKLDESIELIYEILRLQKGE